MTTSATYSNAAKTASCELVATATTGYTFNGYYNSNSTFNNTTLLSSSSTYSYTVSSAKTVYARFVKKTYNLTFNQPANGSIKYNNSTTSPVAIEHGSNASVVITPATGYRIKSLEDNSTPVSAAVGLTSAYTHTISSMASAHEIVAVMELDTTALSAPTNIRLNNTEGNLSVDAKRGEKVTLSWDSVTNADSYTVYKGDTAVATGISGTSYQIEKGYSYTGSYSVVAVPVEGSTTYGESAKSTARQLTVNKVQLAAPTVTMNHTEIDTTGTVTFTLTNTNTAYTATTDYKYMRRSAGGTSFSTEVTGLSYTTGTFSTSGDKTYKFKTVSQQSDYYTDSAEVSKTFHVSKYAYCLTGDMVTNQGGSAGWPTTITKYPVNTFVSKNIFSRTVIVSGGTSTDKHYFRLTNQSNQYTVQSGVNTDMSTHNSSATAVTASTTGTNGAMYVTGNGTYKIYVDQSTSGSPKVWVESNEYSLTARAYYQTFNLATDTHNSAQAGSTGGTVKFSLTANGEATASAEITKGQQAVMIATPETGYYFDGWYTNSDFAAEHKINGATSTYSFTPNANGEYFALFKKDVPPHYNLSITASIAHATVTATYNGTTIQEGDAAISVPEGATVNYVISLDPGCQLDSSTPAALNLTTGTNKSFVMPSSNTVINVTASKINYTLTGVASPNKGTVTFYSDSSCTHSISTAQYQDVFYAKYMPPSNLYVLNNFTKSGTGLSGPTAAGTNVASFTMGTANATITANVIAATPEFGTNANQTYNINDGTFTYTPDVSKYTSVSYTLKNSSNVTKAYSSAVTTPSTPSVEYDMASIGGVGVYTLTITATNQPDGISTAKTSTTIVTITVKHNEYQVTYYLDLHDTEMDTTATHCVYAVDAYYDDAHVSSANVLKDESTYDIWSSFSHVTGSEHIYQATLLTPCDDTAQSTPPTELYAMIDVNGKQTIVTLAVSKLDSVNKTGEVWLEFARGSKVSLSRSTEQNSTKIPPGENKQRIYLKRPANLGTDWSKIHVYYWRNVNGTETTYSECTWNNAPIMTKIGVDSSGDEYYYCDIHSKANMIIFQGRNSSDQQKEQTDDLSLNSKNYWFAELDDGEPVFDAMSENAVVPAAKTYNDVITMSTNETAATLYTGGITAAKTVFTSDDSSVCAVSNTGKLTPGSSTGDATITTTIYGTIGSPDLITTYTNQEKITLNTTVHVINPNDPDRWSYKIMSYGSNTTTITTNTGGRLTSILSRDLTLCDSAQGSTAKTFTNAGICTTSTDSGSGIVTYTIRYASPEPTAYSTIDLTASVTSIPIQSQDDDKRYGFDHWENDSVTDDSIIATTAYSTVLSERITTSKNILADGSAYVAVYLEYEYTDLTITYNYLEYKTDHGAEGHKYQYDASKFDLVTESGSTYETYKSGTTLNNEGYCEDLHTLNSYTVTVEVQGRQTASTSNPAIAQAIRKNLKKITNNYYNYSYDSYSSFSSDPVYPDQTIHPYNMSVGVNLSRKVKTYQVKVNKLDNTSQTYTTDENGAPIYYQSYVTLNSSNNQKIRWIVEDSTTELNIGKRFRFRVPGNISVDEVALTDQNTVKERSSSITHTNHEIRDEETTETVNNVTTTTHDEILIQNFYIADFFNTKMYRYTVNANDEYIPDDNSLTPFDNISFVGGGVFYFSVDSTDTELRVPAVKQYLEDDDTPNPEALENVVTQKILENRVEGEDDLKPYYGTEIQPMLVKDGNTSTGLIFKYTPYEIYNSTNHTYTKNTKVFRYSNELKAYQYVYGAEMKNLPKNASKYMRMYSYYIFSYSDYDSNGDEYTAYKMVISNNHGFAPTYVDSTPTNN